MIRDEWKEWFDDGPAIILGTGARDGTALLVRATGLRVESPTTLRICCTRQSTERMLAELPDRPLVAVTLTRLADLTCLQLKGEGRVVPVDDDDLRAAVRYRDRFLANAARIFAGLPSQGYLKFRCEPEVCVRVTVSEVFNQAPGPQAGKRVSE